MKTVPLLLVMNVITLAGLAVLFLKQQDLSEQLDRNRSGTSRYAGARTEDDSAAFRILFDDIEGRLKSLERSDWAPDSPPARVPNSPAETGSSPGMAPTFPAEGTDTTEGTLSGEAMDDFRLNVKKAQELNRREDRVNSLMDRLDRLADDGKIAALEPAKKKRTASLLLRYQDRTPEIWRAVMSRPGNRELPWQDRRQLISEAYESLRGEARKELEQFLPQTEAEVIAQEGMSFRGSSMRSAARAIGR